MALSKEEINILVSDITNLAELNVLHNLKVFVSQVAPKGETFEDKLKLLDAWLDVCINELEIKLNLNKGSSANVN